MAKIVLMLLTVYVSSVVSASVDRPQIIRNGMTQSDYLVARDKRDINRNEIDQSKSYMVTTQEPLSLIGLENQKGDCGDSFNGAYDSLPQLTMVKRAPTGFMGMRGKKDSDFIDTILNMRSENDGSYYGNSEFATDKRAPTGFMGMRGKKVSKGFYGVRGKKDMFDEPEEGTEEYVNQFDDIYNPDDEISGESDENETWDWRDQGKRMNPSYRYYYADNVLGNEFSKRTPKGFMGMRGRRSIDVDEPQWNEKRSAFSRFFGVRGKKQELYNAIFGKRGKKQPFSFRNKFVGVRGKKSALDNSLWRLELDYLRPYLQEDYNTGKLYFETLPQRYDAVKRVPHGFVGMRGKKDSQRDAIRTSF